MPATKTRFARIIEEIIELAGLTDKFDTSEQFYLKVYNDPYMPLTIEAFYNSALNRRVISVAHYYKQNGDLIPDPDVVITPEGYPISYQDSYGYIEIMFLQHGNFYVHTSKKNNTLKFLATFARNIKEQGFIEAVKSGQFITK
ncbi:MAG TPA: hypothetical protein P5539_11200 [Mesotoga sp.]|nr:hypothetical protein [Mesotoga sp.]